VRTGFRFRQDPSFFAPCALFVIIFAVTFVDGGMARACRKGERWFCSEAEARAAGAAISATLAPLIY